MNDITIQCEPVKDAPLPDPPKEKPKKPTFVPPPSIPTQEAVNGIRFDFNNGLRVQFPEHGEYRTSSAILTPDVCSTAWTSSRAARSKA